jgi:hypothetical protein
MDVDVGGVSNLPLLKWPDVAQSALNYAETISKTVTSAGRRSDEVTTARAVLRSDLCIAIAGPIEAMHTSTKEHIKKHIGKEPNLAGLSTEERGKFPVQYKNRLIGEINGMFKTLSTMTGVEYPELRKRDNGSRN